MASRRPCLPTCYTHADGGNGAHASFPLSPCFSLSASTSSSFFVRWVLWMAGLFVFNFELSLYMLLCRFSVCGDGCRGAGGEGSVERGIHFGSSGPGSRFRKGKAPRILRHALIPSVTSQRVVTSCPNMYWVFARKFCFRISDFARKWQSI